MLALSSSSDPSESTDFNRNAGIELSPDADASNTTGTVDQLVEDVYNWYQTPLAMKLCINIISCQVLLIKKCIGYSILT